MPIGLGSRLGFMTSPRVLCNRAPIGILSVTLSMLMLKSVEVIVASAGPYVLINDNPGLMVKIVLANGTEHDSPPKNKARVGIFSNLCTNKETTDGTSPVMVAICDWMHPVR